MTNYIDERRFLLIEIIGKEAAKYYDIPAKAVEQAAIK